MDSGATFEQTAWVHVDFLTNMAVKMTRNEDDAHDLVQETFLRAYRFFDKYEPGTNCKAWLCQILRNSLINRYRQQHRRPSEVDFDCIEGTRESLVLGAGLKLGDPEETLMNSMLTEDVRQALVQLPPGFRAALSLSLVGGFSYREIADRLGCPIGTIMSRVHRARKLMQKRLQQHAATRPRAAVPGRMAENKGTERVRNSAPCHPHATRSVPVQQSPVRSMFSPAASHRGNDAISGQCGEGAKGGGGRTAAGAATPN
jgi:RNA polymerase sigma-70 factor, ECF subfamily